MVILDTSFLFAYFQKNDEFHEKAKKLAEKIRGELTYVTFLVMQELMTLLTSKISSAEALRIYGYLFNDESDIRLLNIDDNYTEETLQLFARLSPHRFSYVDVSLIILAKEFEAKVLTFDRRLEEKLKQS